MAYMVTVILGDAHQAALRAIGKAQQESLSGTVRRLLREEAQRLGVWEYPRMEKEEQGNGNVTSVAQ